MEQTFESMADLLLHAGITENPSELHGMLCGRLSGGQQLSNDGCLEAIVELFEADHDKITAIGDELVAIHHQVAKQLDDTDFGFDLILPDDDFELTQRLDCLGQWCQGFLVGLGLSGLSGNLQFSADAADALKDLAQIAQVCSKEMDSEEGEVSYFEVVEYVRMAVLMVQSEVITARRPEGGDKPTLH